MRLVEETEVPLAALPIEAFRDHLKLGRGFADDALQDVLLEALLRAALAAIEARTGKALLQRPFVWTLPVWDDRYHQALPVAPVSAITEIRVLDADGVAQVVGSDAYLLMQDTHLPRIEGRGALPSVTSGGRAEVRFEAGFGPDWSGVPRDLAQAVLLLATHYYEHRGGEGDALPQAVCALVESHRRRRIGARG